MQRPAVRGGSGGDGRAAYAQERRAGGLRRAVVRGGVERVERSGQVVGEVPDVRGAVVGELVGEPVEVRRIVADRVDQVPERLLVHNGHGGIAVA